MNWYKKYIDTEILKSYGRDESFLDKTIKKLLLSVRINRVIECVTENQVEIKQQLWTFNIVKH